MLRAALQKNSEYKRTSEGSGYTPWGCDQALVNCLGIQLCAAALRLFGVHPDFKWWLQTDLRDEAVQIFIPWFDPRWFDPPFALFAS